MGKGALLQCTGVAWMRGGGWGEGGKNRGIGGLFPHCPPPITCFHTLSYLDPPRSVGDTEGILHFSYS